MTVYLKILAALAPAIILAMIIIRKDKQQPEPIGWLLVATVLGALAGPAVLLLHYLGLPDIPIDSYLSAFLTSFINAAIPEEVFKFLALLLIANKCKYFDEFFDGIVYSVCIGMGFAGLENILYLIGADDLWYVMGISRALMAVPTHYFLAVIMGAFFSLGWFDRNNRTVYLSAALVLPIILHGLYDTLCFSMQVNDSLTGYILVTFLVCFKYIRRYTKSLIVSMLKLDGFSLID